MTDIVFQGSEGQPLTNSVLVAEKFGKRHCDLIKAIRNLTTQNFVVKNMFVETTYLSGKQQEQPMYIMNRDGFTLWLWASPDKRHSNSNWTISTLSTRWSKPSGIPVPFLRPSIPPC